MTLRDLIAPLDNPLASGNLDTEITSIAYDSRKVKAGCAYVAVRGTKTDGHDFIDTSIKAGASAIFAEQAPPDDCATPWVHVSSARKALATLAATLLENPAEKLKIAGVTGTNGKSTTAFIVQHLMNLAQRRCGLIGTMFYDVGDGEIPATHTTPQSLEIQQLFKAMVDNGCRGASMEVSSHALHQLRVHGIPFTAGVFTNLTQDHLDYHSTMEEYFEAKRMLFDIIAAQSFGKMIINGDDMWGRKLVTRFSSTKRVVTFGMSVGCDIRATDVRYDLTGTTFTLEAKGRQMLARTPLIGDFNVYNSMAALAAADALGANFRESVRNLATIPQVPGRLERVSDDKNRFHVFVDYAHTPDAIASVLRSLRVLRPRRIITVFGCGGDRDRLKRPLMARAAEEGSDICVLTSDNPRTEDPVQIMKDAAKGFAKERNIQIVDRYDAIFAAITHALEGDIVLIAGKGHEDYQEINGEKHPFDDRRVAHGALASVRATKAEARVQRMLEQEERENAFFDRFMSEPSARAPWKSSQPQAGQGNSTRRRWNT